MKLIVSASSYDQINTLVNKDIYGIIVSVNKLSVNDSFYIDVDEIDKIDFKDKKVFISLNKIMHNSDLEYLRRVINKIKNKDIKIIFYDMAVYNIARAYNILDKLIICQDHLNASVLSNNFYYNIGIKGSYITSDITGNELNEIKNNTKMDIYFMAYGYAPIFYSRRYLITNYLKYIKSNDKSKKYELLSDTGEIYPISEEAYGTTIYSPKPINLINHLDELKNIDYLVLRSNMIDDAEFNRMVDSYIKKDKVKDEYIGFFDKKTIYRVK